MQMSNLCRCCLQRPPEKKLKSPYTRSGKIEIYSNILKECFEIHLTYLPNDDEYGICEVCVGRLRDASDFKLQVQRSQEQLQAWLWRGCNVKEENSLKAENPDNPTDEELLQLDQPIKIEVSDPLPTEEEEFKLSIRDLENHTLDVCKQESIKMSIIEHSPRAKSCIDEFGPGVALKKERKFRMNAKNKNQTYNCDTCGRQFKREVGLNIHKKTHTKGAVACEICNKQFRFRSRLEVHKKIHTGEKPFWCEQCKKCFSDNSNLLKHKLTHNGEKPFGCDICKARYASKQYLASHMALHMGVVTHYRCKLCPVKFTDRKKLRIHVKGNHIGLKYTCDVCQRVFYTRSELTQHLNVHFKWSMHPCDICGLTLSTKNSLQRHKLVHTGDRPYTCEICNKQFRHKHSLNDHILTHTGEKPHCCEVCGKKFGKMSNLKKHLEIHVEGKIYACEFCTKSYSTSEGLRQHRRTHTKNKLQVKPKIKKEKKHKSLES
ncbi:zinc finger protein 391-like isoform X2 [Leguminivora glycinivorella]|uniref:zinc finger protein 391-like isoform X2 n=1 Tax=Leguminivora glycinivorella TaxID=1035111 RepID=UPI00200F4B62|nr:zinc finger protein 391-like isoform X2 [Leguminivora glycinivorella]